MILLTPTLYFSLLWLIYFITESLYPLIPFTYLTYLKLLRQLYFIKKK